MNHRYLWRNYLQIALFAAAATLTACATVSPEQRAHLDAEALRLQGHPAALVTDGCILRDRLGDGDFVLRNASVEVGQAIARSAEQVLAEQGLPLSKKVTPFVCGVALLEKDNQPVAVADTVDDETRDRVDLPIVLDDRLAADADLVAGYRALLESAVKAPATPAAKAGVAPPQLTTQLALDDAMVTRLKAEFGTSTVWVARVAGAQVSAGKSIGYGMLTGLGSAILSGGTYIVTSQPISGSGMDLVLIDLDDKRVRWKKSLSQQPGDPSKTESYDMAWARNMFDPLFPKPAKPATATQAPPAASAP